MFQRATVVCGASQGDYGPSAANNSCYCETPVLSPANDDSGPWLDHMNYGQVDDFTINIAHDDKISIAYSIFY